jgi:hypothetical protein
VNERQGLDVDEGQRRRKVETNRAWCLRNADRWRELKHDWYWRNLDHARALGRARTARFRARHLEEDDR